MSTHRANIRWSRDGRDFSYENYSRNHRWDFPDAGVTLAASAAPAYLGDRQCVDPEEAFVASVSSCHMLTFLALASRRRLVVDAYADEASGILAKNPHGRLAVVEVTLRPQIDFAPGHAPDAETIQRLHDRAHKECFIANSVNCRIRVTGASGS